MNGWPKFLIKILPLIIESIIILLMVSPVHEYWHAIVARWVRQPGYVDLYPLSGHFWFSHPEAVSAWQEAVVWMAGGLGTALCFGALWIAATMEGHYSNWEVDEQVVFGATTIFQAIYGITEGLSRWMDVNWGYYVGVPVAVGVIGWLYMRRFVSWLEA